jgi:asparagine synthase (glutamine-hydrolysing)
MCGIAGGILFNRQIFDRTVLQKMTDVIRHRGPDDSGMHIDGSVGLGFRRLSIIDLSPAGHQPMAADHEKRWITFNGEIYNFESLRKDLEKEGVVFNSHSDTEVILQLYLKYGTGCFGKLRGMFGIAIWDTSRGKLILARDRVGKKPLYYYKDEEKLLFSSELKSIYQYPGLDYTIDEDALAEYFSYGFIASPRSIYRSVAKLQPGSFLEINLDGELKADVYWKFTPPAKPLVSSVEEAKQLVFDKVDESIKLRMRSDVPVGAFLSGGIDSTIVVARMAQHTDKPVKTFTIGFKDKAFDESEYAALVAKRYHTEHHLEIIDPDYADLIEDILCNFDEPFGDSSALPTHVVSKMISKHVTVALSGDGGDEAFGGYEIYQEILQSRKLERIPSAVTISAGSPSPILTSGSSKDTSSSAILKEKNCFHP